MRAGLRTKMLVPTLGVVLLCMGISSFLSTKRAAGELRASMINSATLLANNLGRALSNFTDDFIGAVVLQSKNDKIVPVLREKTPESLALAVAALTDLTKFDESIQAANLLDTKGETVASSDPAAKGNFADREYFKRAMGGAPNISEPLLSRVTNKPVFIVAAPVISGGKTLGVIYTRVDLGRFSQDMVAPVRIGNTGYAYMADKSGLLFSHPDPDKVLKLKIADFDWGRAMLASQSGALTYEFDGKRITGVYVKEKNTGWLTVIAVNESDIADLTSSVRNTGITLGVGGIVLVCVSIVLVLNHTLASLGRCVNFAHAVAEGSLDSRLEERREDELGDLADSLRTMVGSLRDMIGQAQDKTREAQTQTELATAAMRQAEEARHAAERAKADGMCQAAGRLEGVVAVVTSASEQLSAQIEQSSRGAERQSQRLTETATAMEEMNATVLEVSKNSASAATTTDDARANAQEGSGVVAKAVDAIARVRDQAETLKEDMGLLGRQAQDIGRIMGVINDIADQTNLLALNAAIEAARAGDAGRGFAVVADEVRKLAEKTMAATKEVGDAIQGIQQGTTHNIKGVDEAVRIIREANDLATQSGASLREIVGMTHNASDQVRSIATAAEEQSAASEQISRAIDDVSVTSRETSQAMAQAAKAVADLAEQAHVLTRLIEEMEAEAKEMTCRELPA